MPKKRMDAALQEKSISQVLLKHFMQEQEVAIRRLEGVHLLKISGNYL